MYIYISVKVPGYVLALYHLRILLCLFESKILLFLSKVVSLEGLRHYILKQSGCVRLPLPYGCSASFILWKLCDCNSDSKELLLKRPRAFPLRLPDLPGGLKKGDTGVIRATAVRNMGSFVSSYN